MGAPTCSRQEAPTWAFPISTIPIPTTILLPSTVLPGSAWRLARRVKSAAGGIWANKPIQAAELMGAPTCSRQETPAWAFPISTIPIPTTILSPSTVPPRSARRLARRVKSAVGGIWANKPIQAAELMGAPTCSRQETPAWAFPISTIPIPTTILSPSTVPPRSARRLARRVKSAAGGIWANKPIQAAELMGAPTCSRQEAPAWASPKQALHQNQITDYN